MTTQLKLGALKKGLLLTKNYIVKQSPIMLTIAGVGGIITTVVMAVKATTKADRLLEEKKAEEGLQVDESLTVEETVKTVWKEYVPTAISAALTITAIVGAAAINEKRKAALAGLYALSETALKEYQDKAEEIVGPKKAQEIKDKVNQASVRDTICPFTEEQLSGGSVPIKDLLSGRLFYSTPDRIRNAAAEINQNILGGDLCASLNEFYEIVAAPGLEPNALGGECGWNMDTLCKPYFTSSMTSDMRPILVLDWDRHGRPVHDYRDI